jgi:hypothetical protein
MEESNGSIFKSPIFYSSIFAIIVCSLAYYFLIFNKKINTEKTKNTSPSAILTISKEVDSDEDGLPDWKELVYGSDSKDKDTDKDGKEDGDEVNNGRDPTIMGPNDLLLKISLDGSTSSPEGSTEKNFVEEFMSKEIQNIGSETVEGLVKNFNSIEIKPRYGLSNLNITSDNTEESLHNYANSFGTIIKKYTTTDIEDEHKIMTKALETKRGSDLQKLELPAITYRNFAEDLKKLEAPSALAEHHLNVVSGYDVMSRSLFTTTKLFSNPVAGGAGWQMYLTQMVTVTRGYAGIINVLNDKHIVFSEEEPGYHFRWRGAEGIPVNKMTASTTISNKK